MSCNMKFRLYPDCQLVRGRSRDAIYDLTRNDIYLISHDVSSCISNGILDLELLPTERRDETVDFFIRNELGRFNMPHEIISISDEYISPSIISNSIVEIGNFNLPLDKVAFELSELICDSICLIFLEHESLERIVSAAINFDGLSMTSIEICLQYEETVFNKIKSIIDDISLCTRVNVFNSPSFYCDSYKDIPIKYVGGKHFCEESYRKDFSVYANSNLPLYCESLHHNNCLNRKVVINQFGDIKNCPYSDNVYGNINEVSLKEVVLKDAFQKHWFYDYDDSQKCGVCELRYACQHCDLLSKFCIYPV